MRLAGMTGALAVLMVCAGAARAQSRPGSEPGRLAGTVGSEAGPALRDVVVEVVDTGLRAVTDERGRWMLAGVPAGSRALRFRLLGWGEVVERVEVEPGGMARVDVQLAVSPIELAWLAVTAERTRLVGGGLRSESVPGAAHVIGVQRLAEERRIVDDVHAVLRHVPGVNVQEEDGFGLRPNVGIRGTGVERSSKVAVLEDGVLAAPAPYAAPAAYYFPVVGRMDAVEVRKGSSQIEYGPWTTGGAVNLVSSGIPAAFRLDGELSRGSKSTHRLRARVGDTYGNFGWLVETLRVETDGFKRMDGGGGTGFDIADHVAKLRVNTDPGAAAVQELELKLGRTDERSDETYLGLTQADFEADPLRRYVASQRDVMNADHRLYQLRHVVRASARVDVTTTLYRNEFTRNWYKLDSVNGRALSGVVDDPASFPVELAILRGEADSDVGALKVRSNRREYYSQGVQSVLGVRFGSALHAFTLGVRRHADAEDRFQHDDGYQMLAGRMLLTSAGVPGSQDNRMGEADAWTTFASLRLRVGRWILTPGLRFESVQFRRTDYAKGDATRASPTQVRENEVDVWLPGLGFAGEIGRDISLFGGVHRGFGPPGPGADAATRAEESVNYELGARIVRGSASAQATVFYNDYRNILGRATLAVGETGTGDLFNGGAVDVKGLELSAEYEPFRLHGVYFPFHVAYTWTEARFASSFQSEFDSWGQVERGDRLPYLPEHQLAAGARLASPRWSVGITAVASSRMRTRAGHGPIPHGSGTDAFLVLNASADFEFTRGTVAWVGLQNISDERYVVARRPAGARPGLPRSLNTGVRFTLR
ncbi:MAG: TonB-dependent receptor [Gemmatimonadetes bacterium]|nr:TonB-dependent receptor [Gemmatimonadota bacterium]